MTSPATAWGTPSVHFCRHRSGLQRRSHGIELPQHLNVRIMSGHNPILGVQLDGANEDRHTLISVSTKSQDGGHHIERVVVVGILTRDGMEVGQRFIVVFSVKSHRGREDPLLRC